MAALATVTWLRAPKSAEIYSTAMLVWPVLSLAPSLRPSSPEDDAQHLFYLLQERPQLELGMPVSHSLRLSQQQLRGWGRGTLQHSALISSRKPSLAELLKGEARQPGVGKQRAQTKRLDIEEL